MRRNTPRCMDDVLGSTGQRGVLSSKRTTLRGWCAGKHRAARSVVVEKHHAAWMVCSAAQASGECVRRNTPRCVDGVLGSTRQRGVCSPKHTMLRGWCTGQRRSAGSVFVERHHAPWMVFWAAQGSWECGRRKTPRYADGVLGSTGQRGVCSSKHTALRGWRAGQHRAARSMVVERHHATCMVC